MFFILALLILQLSAPPRKTVWDGVYTATQAERGRAVYEEHCFECHNGDLDPQNTSSRLIGDRFMDRWREESVDYLFNFVSTSMPRRAPASLTKNAYLDAVSFLFHLNKFPPGNQELTLDVLQDIQFQREEGPRPLPGNSLVQVVGCLIADADDTWMITHATEPARTRRNDEATPEELKAATTKPLGPHSFRLQNFAYAGRFDPLDHRGEKILIKGTLIRQINRERINLTYVKVIDTACEP
ncbi:MAG: c-type cytochrome [Acidobacteria bacterium]|nr:c-type cytochrome [Acidobacteriota bacterium]